MQKQHKIFFIKSPNEREKRASFSINVRSTPPINGRRNTVVRDERVDALNYSFKQGAISLETARDEVKRMCSALNEEQRKKEAGIWTASSDNLKLFDEYYLNEYSDRKIRRPERARDALLFALNIIGPTPLLADRRELQKIVDTKCHGHPRRQRRVCSSLNQMRRFFGITKDRLKREQKSLPKFLYLTETEFLLVLPFIQDWRGVSAHTLRSLFQVLFYCGARPGEAFALQLHHLAGNKLKVHTAIDPYGLDGPTKNGKRRTTVLFDKGLEAFQHWLRSEDKENIDRTALADVLRSACKKAFPNRPG